MEKQNFILIHPQDNILVCRADSQSGETVVIDDTAYTLADNVTIGHKIARYDLVSGDRVMKYGVPIGTMTANVSAGGHIHMHNMKSDYIPSHHRDIGKDGG